MPYCTTSTRGGNPAEKGVGCTGVRKRKSGKQAPGSHEEEEILGNLHNTAQYFTIN